MGFTLPTDNPAAAAERVRSLTAVKESIEIELSANLAVLETNKVTQTTPLVDRDGFPRADIDIWAVRTARVRIIELRNDLQKITWEIGTALEQVYRPAAQPATAEPASTDTSTSAVTERTPFAKVGGVSPASPASEAGLQREDLIVTFGHLTQASFTASTLQPLAVLVAAHENRPLNIEVMRASETVHLTLTPRKGWGGPGMLGCHVTPYRLNGQS